MARKKRTLVYRAHMSVGAIAAESDAKFLNECFVHTGDYSAVQDFQSPKCILLGRTGTGKSATIIRINQSASSVISIDPQSLSLNYISNSDVLRFFNSLGVKLDIFYRLLWQHVICVELLKHHFRLQNESHYSKFKDWISSLGRTDKSKQMAAEYLEKWNSRFWVEREERIKEITKKLENDIVVGAGLEKLGLKADLSNKDTMSTEIKSEIMRNAQRVVNEIQIQHLSQVIDILAEDIFSDPKKKIFITIDSLDDDWVEDEVRYKLIRALIEAVKKFRKISNLKIVVAIRTDLLDRVYRNTRDSGFQEEKYEDLNLRISWKPDQLRKIIDERINLLFKDQYTGETLDLYDVFPEQVKPGVGTFEYLIQRTLMRPRDLIAFVNLILERAQGAQEITGKMILDTENIHSEKRFEAILQEWFSEYPKLKFCASLLQSKPTSFSPLDITDGEIDSLIDTITNYDPSDDLLEKIIRAQLNTKLEYSVVRQEILNVLFKVGFVGYKDIPTHPFVYSYNSGVSTPPITPNGKIQIHPMFWWVFGNQKLKGAVLDAGSNAA